MNDTVSSAPAENRWSAFRQGMRDGIPIALGYFAVAFSLGIAAREAGLTAFQGFLASLFNNASAGEYAGFTIIREQAPYLSIAVITLITNARYLLMSCALSQKFTARTPFYHRILIGFDVTDELFGITIARPGVICPAYAYGAYLMAMPGWAFGTAAGIVAGNVLPERVVSALSVALFGMFLAIIIPPARKDKIIAGLVAISFVSSYLASVTPPFAMLSEGTRIIILTVLLAALAAWKYPVKETGQQTGDRQTGDRQTGTSQTGAEA